MIPALWRAGRARDIGRGTPSLPNYNLIPG
jgi:hypothetical protein